MIFRTQLTGTVNGVRISDYNGQAVTVLHPLDLSLYDLDETGPMSVVKASDGTTFQVFDDELSNPWEPQKYD